MPFSIVSTQEKVVLTLEGAVTVGQAQDLAASLTEGLENGTRVGVNTAGLKDIDTCILQLLCSLRRTVAELSFDGPSEAFLGAVDRCGLRRELLGAREGL